MQYKALFQEFCDIFTWTYTEMLRMDPAIVEHHIDMRPDASPIRQQQCPLNLVKAPTIKAEIDKLLRAGFIYPIEYTSWVSNPFHVNKKQGDIHVFIDYRDLNVTFPKDNYPTPFIDQVVDECAGHEVLSFLDGFLGYNQI